MDAIGQGLLLQLLMLPNDIGIGNEGLKAIFFPHFTRFNRSDIRIDDWKEAWCFENMSGTVQLAEACPTITVGDLKLAVVAFAARCRLVCHRVKATRSWLSAIRLDYEVCSKLSLSYTPLGLQPGSFWSTRLSLSLSIPSAQLPMTSSLPASSPSELSAI